MLECKKVPSLVDLCVRKWLCDVRLLGNVGEIDEYLLDRMLPLCSVDQLKHVEESTKGRDLSPLTDKLWKKFYVEQFGNTNGVAEMMGKNQRSFKWKQLYEEKVKEIDALERMRLLMLYEDEEAYRGPGYYGTNSESNEMTSEEVESEEVVYVEEMEEQEDEEEEEEEEARLEEAEVEDEEEEEEEELEEEEEEEEEDIEDNGHYSDDFGYDDGGYSDDYGYDDVDYGDDFGYDDYD